MTEIFTEDGQALPVTVIQTSPLVVTQVKTKDKDGYVAVQYGYGTKRESLINKAQKGHFKGTGNFRHLREMRVADEKETLPSLGDKVDLSIFKEGDTVSVSSISKGKGFQGVVKRHHFKGGPRTHGQKHSEREPGAIGGGARAGGRVAKGMRMAGRMGGEKVTVANLKVLIVDPSENKIYLKGSLPGRRGTLVEIKG